MMESDYISREAVLDVVYGQHINGRDAVVNARPNTFAADLREIAAEIALIPAADVRPVVRGEWIGAYDDLKCSECGKNWDELRTADGDDWGYWEDKPPYCPNCGADMRPEGGAP